MDREHVVADKVPYIIEYTAGVYPGDDVRYIRKDIIDAYPGSNPCDSAEFAALSVTADEPDHGGVAFQCSDSHVCLAPTPCGGAHDIPANPCADKGAGIYSALILDGDVDTVHVRFASPDPLHSYAFHICSH